MCAGTAGASPAPPVLGPGWEQGISILSILSILAILAILAILSSSMKDNYLFTKEIQSLVAKAGCKLKICFGYINRGDRWIQVGGLQKLGKAFPAGAPCRISSLPQDEIKFGYTHAPHKSFPVVLDSPRERGMEQLPVKELLVREGCLCSLQSSSQGSCPAHIPISKILLALGFMHGIAWKMRAEQFHMEIPSHPPPASPPHSSSSLTHVPALQKTSDPRGKGGAKAPGNERLLPSSGMGFLLLSTPGTGCLFLSSSMPGNIQQLVSGRGKGSRRGSVYFLGREQDAASARNIPVGSLAEEKGQGKTGMGRFGTAQHGKHLD